MLATVRMAAVMLGGVAVGITAITWWWIADWLHIPAGWAAGLGVVLGMLAAFVGLGIDYRRAKSRWR